MPFDVFRLKQLLMYVVGFQGVVLGVEFLKSQFKKANTLRRVKTRFLQPLAPCRCAYGRKALVQFVPLF